MPYYRVVINQPQVIYDVEAKTEEAAEEKAIDLYSEKIEPEVQLSYEITEAEIENSPALEKVNTKRA